MGSGGDGEGKMCILISVLEQREKGNLNTEQLPLSGDGDATGSLLNNRNLWIGWLLFFKRARKQSCFAVLERWKGVPQRSFSPTPCWCLESMAQSQLIHLWLISGEGPYRSVFRACRRASRVQSLAFPRRSGNSPYLKPWREAARQCWQS